MRSFTRLVASLLLVALTGCGYHIGTRHDLIAGVKVRSMAIPVARNRSLHPGAEVALTRALRLVIGRNGALRMTSSHSAQVLLLCAVRAVQITPLATPVSPDGTLSLVQYRLTLTADLRVVSRETRETIWTLAGLQETAEFLTGSRPVETEANSRWALQRAAERLAERAYRYLFGIVMLDEIQKSLKTKGLLPLYCFFGDEPLLIDEAVALIEQTALSGADASFNRSVTTAKEMKPVELLALANSMPMFGDRRFIWVKEAQGYGASDLEALLGYVERPNPKTTLVLSATKVDARLKFFKAFKKSGELTKFNRPYENQIPQWLQGQARQMELKLKPDAARLMAELGGNDLMALRRMLEQLAIYVGGKGEVSFDDVEQVVARVKVNSIFELCDAIGERDADKALQILRNMLQNRVRALQMLSLVVRHYRQLWLCKELVEARVPQSEIASQLGVHPYFVRGIVSQQGRFSHDELERAFSLLLRSDYLLKSSPLREEVIAERLVLQLLGRPL